MKTFNGVLGRVSLIFVFFYDDLSGQCFGEYRGIHGSEFFSITSVDNSVNSFIWNLKYSESENSFKIIMNRE